MWRLHSCKIVESIRCLGLAEILFGGLSEPSTEQRHFMTVKISEFCRPVGLAGGAPRYSMEQMPSTASKSLALTLVKKCGVAGLVVDRPWGSDGSVNLSTSTRRYLRTSIIRLDPDD